jgi:hypothetical protein
VFNIPGLEQSRSTTLNSAMKKLSAFFSKLWLQIPCFEYLGGAACASD